jgi:long-chain acyl-CoA synthetase
LTHDNWVFEAETLAKTLGHHVRPDDKQYLFLPMAHCYGKVLQLCALELGVPTAINPDIPGILKGLSEVRPTFMGAVPRVFEKVHATAGAKARARGPRAYGVFEWAEGVAKRWAKATVAGRPVGPRLAVEHAVADRLVYRQIRKALGGRVRAFLSGGAPLAEELSWFFYGAGVLVLEGYGLTETSAGAVANTLDDFRFGTVGRPAPGVRVKIAPDGEVLLAGRGIMRGYHADPEATAAVLQGGWFHSGDLGEIDKDGFLKITGRKKDILVTAGGKNISPQNLENRVKTQVPWVQELVVLGDRRPFCVALVCIDEAAVQSWADDQGLGVTGYAALSAHPRVQALVWEGISAVNQGLASYETIKAIALLDHLVSVESGELTPSQKVKRKVVESRHLKLLDRLYGVA